MMTMSLIEVIDEDDDDDVVDNDDEDNVSILLNKWQRVCEGIW